MRPQDLSPWLGKPLQPSHPPPSGSIQKRDKGPLLALYTTHPIDRPQSLVQSCTLASTHSVRQG